MGHKAALHACNFNRGEPSRTFWQKGTPLHSNRPENIFAADGMDVCEVGHGVGVMKKTRSKGAKGK